MQATKVLRAGKGRTLSVLGDQVTCKLVGEDNGGALAVFEIAVSPAGGTPPHYHEDCDESYYILEGTLEVQVADQPMSVTPGDFIHIPRGQVHAFGNVTDRVARFLAWVAPAGIEHFFEEMARETGTRSPDQARVAAIASKYRTHPAPRPA